MSRIARVVAPGYPHHVTQRGNRRQKTFFRDGDYILYLELMRKWCAEYNVEIWSYCLMPNHVHLVAVPSDEAALRKAIAKAHWHYTCRINNREGWKGCLWQGRFASYVMDENYLCAAVDYIELNPVRAGLAAKATDYPWSSAKSRISGGLDTLAVSGRLNEILAQRRTAGTEEPGFDISLLKKHSATGRPLGSREFLIDISNKLGRVLIKGRPGPKSRNGKLSCVSP